MATYLWGNALGTAPLGVNPTQGPIRRFLLRNRVDCTASAMVSGLADTTINKVLIIPAGWNVNKVYLRLVKKPTLGSTILKVLGATSALVWASACTATTATAVGHIYMTKHDDTYGSDNYSDGIPFQSAGYIKVAATIAAYDGIFDIFADVTDLNLDENPASFTT